MTHIPDDTTTMQGHDEPCHYCGKPCNSFACNPGEWPIPLCHRNDPGVVKWHHIGCVSDRLIENQPAPIRASTNLYSLEIEGLVKHKHKLEAEIARLRASTMPHTDQEREDHINNGPAVMTGVPILKPCPVCGGAPYVEECGPWPANLGSPPWAVGCHRTIPTEHFVGINGDDRVSAIRAWNEARARSIATLLRERAAVIRRAGDAPILDHCVTAGLLEWAADVVKGEAVPRAQTERERHEALERARKEGWDAAIADRALAMPSEDRAKTLLENTKRLRFFKGEVYDGGADEYLRQLHSFLTNYLAFLAAPQAPTGK